MRIERGERHYTERYQALHEPLLPAALDQQHRVKPTRTAMSNKPTFASRALSIKRCACAAAETLASEPPICAF